MRSLLFTAVLAASFSAHAGNLYIVNGKFVEQGQAEEEIRKNPKTQVMKVSATFVQISPKTGNFKKFDDVSLQQLKDAVSKAK